MAEFPTDALRRILATLLAIPLSLTLPATVLAAPEATAAPPEGGEGEAEPAADDNESRAMEAYGRGTKLYNDANFEEALKAFEEAATLYASPAFQFNIAKCHERLGNLEEAIRHYETYLRTSDETPDRAVIESSIADLKKRLEAQEKGEKDPGPTEPVDKGPSAAEKKAKKLTITGGALIGVGAAIALGGGIGFGIPVAEKNNQLGELQSPGGGGTFEEAEKLDQEARNLFIGEIVMISVGAAVAVTGIALIGVGASKKKKAMAFTPILGPRMTGFAIGGKF